VHLLGRRRGEITIPGSIIAAGVGAIPTLDMQTSAVMTQGILDPWYAMLVGLSGLIVVMVILEIVKKYKVNFKWKLW
jgi:hypothetical protein